MVTKGYSVEVKHKLQKKIKSYAKGFSVEVKHKLQEEKKVLCWKKLLLDMYLIFNAACTWKPWES